MSTGKVVIGVVTGLAVGALTGILFAPSKGSKTRKKIAGKSKDYVDSLKNKFDKKLDGLSDKFEKMKADITDFADKGEAKAKETIDGAKFSKD